MGNEINIFHGLKRGDLITYKLESFTGLVKYPTEYKVRVNDPVNEKLNLWPIVRGDLSNNKGKFIGLGVPVTISYEDIPGKSYMKLGRFRPWWKRIFNKSIV